MKKQHFLGIDISKKTLDVACHTNGLHVQVANSPEGLQQLTAWLKENKLAVQQCFFLFEHTGLYGKPLERFCVQQGWNYCAVPGMAIKRSLGIVRGKNDRVDAARIARYGYEKREQLHPCLPADPRLEELKTLCGLRNKLVSQKAGYEAALKEQQHFMPLDPGHPLFETQHTLIACLQQQIARAQEAMMNLIHADPALSRNYELLTSITGISFVNAVYALVATRNFTLFATARKFASYCGTAPFENRSGTSVRGRARVSPLANKKIKSLLDQAAKCAINYDKELHAYYQRRIQMGKTKMSTINIVRNKLIYRMFAVIKRQTPFVKNYLTAA